MKEKCIQTQRKAKRDCFDGSETQKPFLLDLSDPHLTRLGNVALLCFQNIYRFWKVMQLFSSTHILVLFFLPPCQCRFIIMFISCSSVVTWRQCKCQSFLSWTVSLPSVTQTLLKREKSPSLVSVHSTKHRDLACPANIPTWFCHQGPQLEWEEPCWGQGLSRVPHNTPQ